jgi:hypothetical protein
MKWLFFGEVSAHKTSLMHSLNFYSVIRMECKGIDCKLQVCASHLSSLKLHKLVIILI